MSVLENFIRGLEFQVYGVFGDVVEFKNETSEMQRFVRIISAGKTFNFAIESENELQKYRQLKGSPVRAMGPVCRNKNLSSVKPVISVFVVPGQSGWKDPSEEEYFSGCVVSGCVKVQNKKAGVYQGVEFRKVQVVAFGDVFELNHVDLSLYDSIPASGMLLIRCRTEPKLSRGAVGKFAEMELVLEKIQVLSSDPSSASQSTPPPPSSSTGRKSAA